MAHSACYIYEKDLKGLPFSKQVPFRVMSGKYTLTVTGTVNSSPTQFTIAIRGNGYDVHFQMEQRWDQDKTVFYSYHKGCINDRGWSEYGHFPSLKPDSNFTITISTVQEDPDKNVFHFKVRVNDDPVYMFRYREIYDIDSAEVKITGTKDGISVSLIRLDGY